MNCVRYAGIMMETRTNLRGDYDGNQNKFEQNKREKNKLNNGGGR